MDTAIKEEENSLSANTSQAESRKHPLESPEEYQRVKRQKIGDVSRDSGDERSDSMVVDQTNGDGSIGEDGKKRDDVIESMEKIEKEFIDLKEKFYAERLAIIKREIEMIKNGTHANYLETVKQLEDKKAQRIWLAEQWRAYQLQCINIAFESEKKQADDEYQNEKRDCKERLMKTTLLKRQQLEEEKNAISLVDPEVRVSTRMLRSKRKDASQPEKIKGGVVIPGGVIKKVSAPEIKIDLTDMEVGEDFETIHRMTRLMQ
jgi:Sin3 histone deacetylase corepressor complex component SDS3